MNTMTPDAPQWARPSAHRTSFVSVTAWIFIGLSLFSTLIGLMQLLIFSIALSPQFAFAMEQAKQHMPQPFALTFGYLRIYMLAATVFSATMLVAAIALLRRKEWGRIAIIGVLAFGILWNLGGIVLQQWLLSSMVDDPHAPPPGSEAALAFYGVMIVVRVFSAVFALGVCVLFAWLIRRLRAPEIAAEFG